MLLREPHYSFLRPFTSQFRARRAEPLAVVAERYDSSLQAAAQELERQRATDSLKKGLERRPEREELVERKQLPPHHLLPSPISSPSPPSLLPLLYQNIT